MEKKSLCTNVDDNELREFLKRKSSKDQLTALFFWAPWHESSQALLPLLEELAKLYEGRLNCLRINVDDNAHTPHQYEVKNIPHLTLIREERTIAKLEGRYPSDKYRELIESKITEDLN